MQRITAMITNGIRVVVLRFSLRILKNVMAARTAIKSCRLGACATIAQLCSVVQMRLGGYGAAACVTA